LQHHEKPKLLLSNISQNKTEENEIILYYMGMMEKTETVMRSVQDFENAEEVYKYMMHFTILLKKLASYSH